MVRRVENASSSDMAEVAEELQTESSSVFGMIQCSFKLQDFRPGKKGKQNDHNYTFMMPADVPIGDKIDQRILLARIIGIAPD
jgi:DNA-directed RNA polymerase specialized sigma54-like protein